MGGRPPPARPGPRPARERRPPSSPRSSARRGTWGPATSTSTSAGTPAPVRFLPAFDNAILGYHDRGRIIDDDHRGLSVTGARVVLVDGRAAATWSADAGTVAVTPLRRFSRAERTAVAEEGRALASFLSDGDGDRVRITDPV